MEENKIRDMRDLREEHPYQKHKNGGGGRGGAGWGAKSTVQQEPERACLIVGRPRHLPWDCSVGSVGSGKA